MADKVTLNTAAVERPELISELFERICTGCSMAIDAKREGATGGSCARRTRTPTTWNALDWAQRGVELGAGNFTDFCRSGRTPILASDLPLTAVVLRGAFWRRRTYRNLKYSSEGAADAALAASIFHDKMQSIRA